VRLNNPNNHFVYAVCSSAVLRLNNQKFAAHVAIRPSVLVTVKLCICYSGCLLVIMKLEY